jgi:hypothetical protein
MSLVSILQGFQFLLHGSLRGIVMAYRPAVGCADWVARRRCCSVGDKCCRTVAVCHDTAESLSPSGPPSAVDCWPRVSVAIASETRVIATAAVVEGAAAGSTIISAANAYAES